MERFLGETLVGESLSPRAEMQRASLLQRLEPHIRRSRDDVTSVVPKIITHKPEINGMNGNNLEEDYEEVPAAIVRTPSSSSSSGLSEDSFRVNLSFSELRRTAPKYGPLARKERGLFSDQSRKYLTVLHKHFLCMYSSEQAVKPFSSLDIQGFIARPVSNPKNDPKRNVIFEIVCPGKRDHQFVARTVKDMQQWVTAICQASIQYIQVSPSPLPNLTVDKSISRSVQNVPAPDDIDGEIYDDAGSVIMFNGKRENFYELQQSDEENYDDVLDTHQENSRLESKPNCEVAPEKKCPPLPPRRFVPSVPQHDLSNQISVAKQGSQYTNVVGVDAVGKKNIEMEGGKVSKWGYTRVLPITGIEGEHERIQPNKGTERGHREVQSNTGTERGHTKVQPIIVPVMTKERPQQSVKHEMQYKAEKKDEEGDEEIYDDICLNDETPKAIKSPVLHEKHSITNGDIKNRAKVIEECLLKVGNQPKPKTSNQFQPNMSTLHKPNKNSGKDTLFCLAQTSAPSYNGTSNSSNQIQKPASNLYEHNKSKEKETTIPSNTRLSSQPPELPPRSYLKK